MQGPYCTLSVLKRELINKGGEGTFVRECSERMRGNSFQLMDLV